MLNKVIIGVVVVAVIGTGAFFLLGSKDNKTTNTAKDSMASANTNSPSTANKDQQESGNIYSLAGGSKAKKCTSNYSGSTGSGTVTMYTDGKGSARMVTDVTTTDGQKMTTNALVTADKVYSWTGAMGFVTDKSASESQPSSGTTSNAPSTNNSPDTRYSLKCDNWTVDEAMLTVPSNVTFSAMPTH